MASDEVIDFHFPYEPYDIQKKFMNELFNSLEDKKLGIFESPTGTIHSENNKAELERKVSEIDTSDSSEDWFSAAAKKQQDIEELRKAKCELKKLQIQDERVKKIMKTKKQTTVANINQKVKDSWKKTDAAQLQFSDNNETVTDDLIPDTYDSEDSSSGDEANNNDEDDGCLKIFYCSRTHSQLSQFINEIKKTAFSKEIRVTSLASRQNLCINEAVNSMTNLSLVNERCLDLLNSKSYTAANLDEDRIGSKRRKTANSCPYYKQNLLANISSHILTEVKDIEELETLGKHLKACPYYGSKHSIKDAQVVVLPYNTILHQKTRQAYNISLEGNIVIVDEAHNLLETIANIHSVIVTLSQFQAAQSQLSEYFKTYGKRFSAKNVLYIRQILYFIKSFIKIVSQLRISSSQNIQQQQRSSESYVKTVHEVLCDTLTENLNYLKIIQFIEKSKLAKKLYGFSKHFYGRVETKPKCCDSTQMSSFLQKISGKNTIHQNVIESVETKKNIDSEFTSSSSILNIVELMRAFVCSVSDGRILVNVATEAKFSSIKYFLLNPASQFHDIVKDCRSVILAGGTMSPMNEFKQQLFIAAGADEHRISQFSCSHVVFKENVLPIAVSRGPTQVLDFTYKNRHNPGLLTDLGNIVVKLCSIVPGGVVFFLPSYDYERRVFQHFKDSGILAVISAKKKVFREPKEANKLDSVLKEYSKAITGPKDNISGAVLFSVVGGKMSEGINFSDDLGRCVVMVGLPYPNSHSPELKEKMMYLDKKYPPITSGISSGTSFYENMCFKAVNQSIGRSIRHRNDHAAIVLLDQRYEREASKKALPSWISDQLKSYSDFERVTTEVEKFFANRKVEANS